ncbi:DUF2269 domain-containing protein [uncultured Corynebacterium sp.]|uniref:DUF2269 domain-containing protein n=1 Tax=uncultured Corynebacterium sp. TaxID=159447 RepID=UPI0025F8289F|nr:DUF2269 domain-containing protein [uncultured Corynebacterium sp.]
MTTFLVFLHVAAAILLIGPVCVSTSSFQTQMAKAAQGEHAALGSARVLHNITNTYGYISAIVPILGLGIFLSDISAYKSQVNFHIAILVAIIAWCLLFFVIIPKQKKAMASLESNETFNYAAAKKPLSAFGGVFNLLWIICLILMYVNF